MFHLAEVDYTTPAGTKEGGVVQPALAVSEGAPNEKPVIEGTLQEEKCPRSVRSNISSRQSAERNRCYEVSRARFPRCPQRT